MNRVIALISRKSKAAVIQFGRNVITELTGNPHVPAPNPSLPEMQALVDAADSASNEYSAGKIWVDGLKAKRDATFKALAVGLNNQARTVEIATGGDPVKVATTGYKVDPKRTPIGALGQVAELRVTPGEDEGALKAVWKRLRGAVTYQVQVSADPSAANELWVDKLYSTRRQTLLQGLASGTKMWVRVRALGTGNPGPWSAAYGCTVP